MSERVLYWDCVGGAAGDMLLASLLDLGASVEVVRQSIAAVGLTGVDLEVVEDRASGLRALRVDMMVRGQLADTGSMWTPVAQLQGAGSGEHHRPYGAIRERIARAELPEPVRDVAQQTFWHLAEAEGSVHGVGPEAVEFHEVGADDAIADIVGVAAALCDLGIDRVEASPLPLGRGIVPSAHGPIPLPAPATLALLAGIPLQQTDLAGESVTPTGAALLKATARAFGPLPSLVLDAVGVGAGHRTWPDRPNVVRALRGEAARAGPGAASGRRRDECIVEANLDDMMPVHVPVLIDALLGAGAADAWATPILMKKGRPGQRVGAIVGRSSRDAVVQTFFRHSSTLGVRVFEVERELLARRSLAVETRFGSVAVKVADRPGAAPSITPEFDECLQAAEAAGVSVQDVFDAARDAARQALDDERE